MNPIFFNCLLLYLSVIFISLLQSRFKLIKDDPVTYFILLLIVPFIVLGKAKSVKTWTGLTAFEVFGYTLVMAYMNAKRIVPKVNEGYIYAYSLFHWYLLYDTIILKGFNFLTILVLGISIYPTFLILRSSFEHKILSRRNKIILYYWFLFTIVFTYLDQVALEIVQPVFELREINFTNTIIVLYSAIPLYFVATTFALLFVGIPAVHLDRSSRSFKERWSEAMEEWRQIVSHKLENYVEYQINFVQVFFLTVSSAILFYVDYMQNIRQFLIFIYTVLIPLVFFYLKVTPKSNIETESE